MSDVRRTMQLDHNGDLHVQTTQDAEPYIDNNKFWQNHVSQDNDTFRRVASVPVNVEHQWLREEWDRGNKDLKYGSPEWGVIVARKLRDPNWKYLLTWDNSRNPKLGWK